VEHRTSPRVRPTVPVATGVFVVYVVIFIGLMKASGFPYNDIFATTEGSLRGAVLPLAAGSLWLIAFAAYARWDFVFRDPRRLSMGFWLWLPLVLMVVTMLIAFASIAYSAFDAGHLLAVIAAAVLVGFAEETLFRGIILRALRNDGRPEGLVVLFSSLWFGFFHLTNLIVGAGASAVLQSVIASAAGVALYLARRGTGALVAGMVMHGLWDLSTFMSGVHANADLRAIGALVGWSVYASAIIALVLILRRDRQTRVLEPAAAVAVG
jgi:uncharacterized protein